ncbi:hypothetical protein [Leifsonia poae]|uniref:hypothetical protein n=1 Tax=Leifsonia poae TaxID=110933 RepID=UPI0022F28623|nr:hypothetical protein [Leifsonia poae]
MTSRRVRPKAVIGWGIGIALGGVLFQILVPTLLYPINDIGAATTDIDQSLMWILRVVVQVVGSLLPYLGASVIGAGLVMLYIDANVVRKNAHAFQLRAPDSTD